MNIAIVDDEIDSINLIQNLLHLYAINYEIVGTCDNIDTAIDLIKSKNPHLIFLDISMPGGDGFQLLDKVKTSSLDTALMVIFTTGYEEHAIKTFKYASDSIQIIDYLVKPISPLEFNLTVQKAHLKYLERDKYDNFDMISVKTVENPKISIPTLQGKEFFFVNDIFYLEASDKYSIIHLVNSTVLVSKGIKDFEQELTKYSFVRCHNSYLVNMNCVRIFNTKNLILELVNGQEIPVSHRKKDEFAQWITKS